MCLIKDNQKHIHVLYGDEPYLFDMAKKQFSARISFPELNLASFSSWGNDVIAFLQAYPQLSDDVRVAFCHVADLKVLNTNSFVDYLKEPIDTSILVVFVDSLDKRAKLYKTLQADHLLFECGKVTDASLLSKILLNEIKKCGGRITEAAYTLFLTKENYGNEGVAEISILNLISDIKRLVAYSSDITEETVSLLIEDNFSAKVFSIGKMILDEDRKGLRIQSQLLSDNAIGTLSALLREYRIAWKMKYYPAKSIGVKYSIFSAMSKQELSQGMDLIMSSIDGIKNGSVPEKYVLPYTFEELLDLHKGGGIHVRI